MGGRHLPLVCHHFWPHLNLGNSLIVLCILMDIQEKMGARIQTLI